MQPVRVNGRQKKTKDGPVHLRKEFTLFSSISFVLGSVMGSTIYLAPRGVLMCSGSVGLALLVWSLSGIFSLIGALCYAELGTTFTKSGGTYTYLLELVGPLPAFLQLWDEVLFVAPASASYVALVFGEYVLEPLFEPCEPPTVLVKLVSILGMALVMLINCWSVKMASRTQVALTIVKLISLFLIIVPGLNNIYQGRTENLANAFEIDKENLEFLPIAFYNALLAYGGWHCLNSISEEVINPNRNIPLALTLSVLIVTITYVLVNVSFYTIMAPAEVLEPEATAELFAYKSLRGLTFTLPVLVAVSCLGALNGDFLGFPRVYFVAAREGQWPLIFSMIHIRRFTPVPSVIIMFPLVAIYVIIGEADYIRNFVFFSAQFYIGLTILGMIIHRHRFPQRTRPFKVPIAFVVLFFMVTCLNMGLSFYTNRWATILNFALTLTGVPVYYLTVSRFRLPRRWRPFFNLCSKKLQILLKVTKQEIKTY